MRIGQGYDLHRLEKGRPLVLGGVSISHTHGLAGHSDGDAVLHAICDALLGALALGDLGQYFSDTDPGNAGRDSADFLRDVVRRVHDAGYRLGNLDCTIVAEAPQLTPHRDAMVRRIADLLETEVDRVSVKATRGEGVGPEGEKLAISVQAIVLLEVAS